MLSTQAASLAASGHHLPSSPGVHLGVKPSLSLGAQLSSGRLRRGLGGGGVKGGRGASWTGDIRDTHTWWTEGGGRGSWVSPNWIESQEGGMWCWAASHVSGVKFPLAITPLISNVNPAAAWVFVCSLARLTSSEARRGWSRSILIFIITSITHSPNFPQHPPDTQSRQQMMLSR